MSIKFMDGFDQYDGQTDLKKAMSTAGYDISDNSSIAVGRTDKTRALQTEGYVKKTFSSTATRVVIGFAYCAKTTRSKIFSIKELLDLDWPGSLRSLGVDGVARPIIGVWYYYEIIIDKDNREVSFYINNELDFKATLPDEKMFIRDYEMTWDVPTDAGAKMIDDLMIIDNSDGTVKDRVGPVSLALRLPKADVITQFSVPNEDYHFANVGKVPPLEGNFIQSNVSKATDTFLSTDDVPAGEPVAVGIVAVARKSDIDGRQMGLLVGDANGENKEVIIPNLTTENGFYSAVFETDASGKPWTKQTIQTTPFGIKVRP